MADTSYITCYTKEAASMDGGCTMNKDGELMRYIQEFLVDVIWKDEMLARMPLVISCTISSGFH